MRSPSTLILPVENQVRELDAKILLACVAAERGFPVVLGSRSYIHYAAASLPRGVYLAKSMRKLSDRMFGIVRDLGHEIVAWDEEGVVRGPDAFYHSRRLSRTALQKVSMLFTWGEDDASSLRRFVGNTELPIRITGNPRIDLLRRELRGYFDSQVDKILDRFGPFVLVNTNFGLVNHIISNLGDGKSLPAGTSEGVEVEFLARLRVHRVELFRLFREMIPALSEALPDHAIVVRPHPVERVGPWEEAAQGCKRVHVINHGSAVPWLIASKALVHNTCTTSIEASVLDRPSIAYEPIQGDFGDRLPNSLSHRCFDLAQLTQTVRAVVEGELGPLGEDERSHLCRHIAALNGPLASERMVDALEEAGYLAARPPRPKLLRYLGGWAHAKLRTGVKQVNMRRPGHRNSTDYHDHRFPPVCVADLAERVEHFTKLLGRFDGTRVRKISEHVFLIDRDRGGRPS